MILLDEQEIEIKQFPNGETLIEGQKLLVMKRKTKNSVLTLKYENDSDLIKLMFVKKFLDENSFDKDMLLKVLYMPYSRMDRTEGVSVFTLKYVSQFINSLGFSKVWIIEPHSNVTPALVDNSLAIYPTKADYLPQVTQAIGFDKNKDYLMFPDAGAASRYKDLVGYNVLVGHKKRNFVTGEIESLEVNGEINSGRKVIIVDDLCSRGGTFIRNKDGVFSGSAKTLKGLGASEIHLLVAHCENTIFEGDILNTDFIDGVFTTNSILDSDKTHEKLHILN